MDPARALADALRTLRQQTGLTQAEMARALNVSRPTLTRIENADQNVTLQTLGRIQRALGCETGDLFKPGQLRLRRRGKP